MLEINEQNHTSVLISSLDNIYNQGKLNGKLNSVNLYILNIIFKLLNNCCITLENYQKRELMELYRKIYFNSDSICKVSNIQKYTLPIKNTFTQAEIEDCNQVNTFPKIYYWQDNDLNSTFQSFVDNVIIDSYFDDKEYDTYQNFELGKTITYSKIGKILFAAFDVLNSNLNIYDVLNNDITDQFNKTYIDNYNLALFVSKNNYSHGSIKIKIIK